MKLIINGEDVEVGDGLSVTELLSDQNVKMPEMVSVEVNGKIVPRQQFESTNLAGDDKVEFLYFMGGGSGESN